LIYQQSGPAAGFRTDASGRVSMNVFQVEDAVELTVLDGQESIAIPVTIDAAPEQSIGAAEPAEPAEPAEGAGIAGTVLDADQRPVADAQVLLISKTWPGGRFRMTPHDSRTNARGEFAFPDVGESGGREELLVSIVKSGFVWQSRYVEKEVGAEVPAWRFELAPAVAKTIILHDAAGRPLPRTKVALHGRVDGEQVQHFIYGISAERVQVETDAEGRVELQHFAVGDRAKLLVMLGQQPAELEFTIDDQPEQSVMAPGGE
jgi:hypothetical protein